LSSDSLDNEEDKGGNDNNDDDGEEEDEDEDDKSWVEEARGLARVAWVAKIQSARRRRRQTEKLIH
jgi:hypothetical protein